MPCQNVATVVKGSWLMYRQFIYTMSISIHFSFLTLNTFGGRLHFVGSTISRTCEDEQKELNWDEILSMHVFSHTL